MANAVGKVAVLEGQAFVRGKDGSQRALKVGDTVMEGDVIVTGSGSRVELAFEGGQNFLVREKETVTLDKSVLGIDLPEGHDAALLDRISETAAITRAIAEGSSLDELLEETSAGLEGGSGEDGHGFVQLLRIAEALPPLSYDYGTGRGYVPPELVGGGRWPDVNPNAPQAINDGPLAATEDTPQTFTPDQLLGNDSDPNGDALTIVSVQGATHGTVSLVGGNIVFTPAANYNGPASFTYTITDGNGNTDTATVTLNIAPVSDLPVAQNDTATTAEDTPVTIAVRGNDSDPDGDVLTVSAVTNGAHGTVAIDPVSGNPVYTPAANWSGTDSFTYTVSDGHGGTSTATVTVTVGAANDLPVAQNDTATTAEDTPVTIAVRGNDSDPDGDVLTVSAVTNGAHGTVAIDPVSGNPVYTPAANWSGTDSFTYTVSDGHGGTSTATVTVTVGAANDLPVAQNDTATTAEDTPVTIAVRGNDSDPDGDVLTVSAVTNGAHGTVAIDPVSGNPVYTPAANWSGTDTFTYTVSDGHGGTSTATVTVTVNPVNDVPTVAIPPAGYVSEEGLAGGLADSAGTPDTTNVTVVSGNLSIVDPDNGSFNITLTAPATALTSGGTTVTWTGGAPGSDLVGSAGGSEVVRVHVTNTGAYTVTLSGPVDHASAGVEDVRALNFGVSVSDGSASAATTLVVNVEDDMPVANHTTSTIQVGVDTISINSLQAGWVNPVFINGTSQTSQNNTDSDAYNDRILWGSPASGSGQSGYVLVDSTSFAGSTGSSVTAGEMFKLADFSHLNWPIYSNSSTLDQVTLTMSMNVVINGVSMPIQYTVLLDHTETPNVNGDPVASRDIITLPAQDVTVNVDGQDYVFRLEGFRDSSGNIVNTIRTDEQATNPFEIYGSVRTIDDLPSVTGTVGIAAGADGSDTGVVWGNTSSSYGTMTANADGTYEFVVSRETRESLSYGQTLTQTFTYTITDRDGDSAPGSVTIEIRAPEEVNLTSTTGDITGLNMGLSGEYFGYNDNRTGTTGDPTYSGSTSTRLHSDDGTADAGTANNIDRLADVEEIVEGRNNNTNLIDNAVLSDPMAADATFSTNKIEFGLNPGSATPYFSNDLGQNGRVASGTIGATAAVGGTNNLYTFLKVSSGNTDALVATSGLGDTTDAVIRMVGYIYVPAGGVYDMRVTADDGYRVLIGGQNIGQADFIQSTATQVYTGFTLTEGLQPIEILYWDQGGHASLRIELKTNGAADSTYKIIGNEEFALFSPSEVPTLAANQDIVESSTNGVWQVRSGEDYTGSSFAEKVTGSDGKDIIRAGGGDDIVDGGAGSDTIVGGAGNDTLTGGLGSDTFAWSLADQGTAAAPARDVVTDFDATSKAAGGDALDLRDLLPNGATTAVSLDEYLHFSKSGSDTVIDVKPTGASGDVTQQIVLSNVDLTLNNSLSDLQIIQDLLTKGKLITD